MKALVVYESMYGNTHQVAEQIAVGLRTAGIVADVVQVNECLQEEARYSDLMVVGGPTHIHTMAGPRSRKAAADKASVTHQTLEASAVEEGLREWFDAMPVVRGVAAAAFDTRQDAPRAITGQASRRIRSRLIDRGFRMVAPPESFLVDKHPRLVDGEAERAAQWGQTLAAVFTAHLS
jgi:Flavodoxin